MKKTITILASTLSLFAQPGSPTSVAQIQGTVTNLGNIPGHHLAAELTAPNHSESQKTFLTPAGGFGFSRVVFGDYMLRLVHDHGQVLYESPVAVRMLVTSIDIHLPERRDAPGRVAPVSSQRLRHRVLREASRLFAKAVQAREREEFAQAQRLLEQALQVDPEFSEAHVNLGAIHARNKDYQAAAWEFEAAVKADPACAVAHSNLAFAYLHLRRPADAERAAQQALRLDPGNETTTGLLNQSRGMKKTLTRMALTFTEL